MDENKKNETEEITGTVEETASTEATLDEECEGIPELQESEVATSEVIFKFTTKETILKVPQKQYEELVEAKVILDLAVKLYEAYDSYDFKKLFGKVLAVRYPDISKD